MIIIIKKFQLTDLTSVMEIWLNTNISTHHFISEDYWYKNYDIVKELIPQAEIYTYIEDDTIKAFIATLDTTYIAGFFVSQPWQSQGIGKKLLDFAKENHPSLELDVYLKNPAAISFYQKNDFQIQSEKTNPNDGEKEYRMKWCKNF